MAVSSRLDTRCRVELHSWCMCTTLLSTARRNPRICQFVPRAAKKGVPVQGQGSCIKVHCIPIKAKKAISRSQKNVSAHFKKIICCFCDFLFVVQQSAGERSKNWLSDLAVNWRYTADWLKKVGWTESTFFRFSFPVSSARSSQRESNQANKHHCASRPR